MPLCCLPFIKPQPSGILLMGVVILILSFTKLLMLRHSEVKLKFGSSINLETEGRPARSRVSPRTHSMLNQSLPRKSIQKFRAILVMVPARKLMSRKYGIYESFAKNIDQTTYTSGVSGILH